MDEYTKMIDIYYTEKFKSDMCNDCSMKKIFTENSDELIFSCGDSSDDKCGEQFKIKLPGYIYKDYEINLLKEKLYKGLSDNGFNYKVLHNNDLIDNVKENDDFIKQVKESIDMLNTDYEKEYYEENRKLIKNYYNKRSLLSEELSDILYTIKTSEDEDLKKELRNKYSLTLKEINELKENILPILNSESLSLTYKEGSVEVINKDYLDLITKLTNKKGKKEKKNKQSESSVSINDFKEGMNVQWNVNKKVYKGVVNKINKKKKNKIEIMIDDGTTKDVNINKLKILD